MPTFIHKLDKVLGVWVAHFGLTAYYYPITISQHFAIIDEYIITLISIRV